MRKTDAFRILAFILIWGGVAQAQTQETLQRPPATKKLCKGRLTSYEESLCSFPPGSILSKDS